MDYWLSLGSQDRLRSISQSGIAGSRTGRAACRQITSQWRGLGELTTGRYPGQCRLSGRRCVCAAGSPPVAPCAGRATRTASQRGGGAWPEGRVQQRLFRKDRLSAAEVLREVFPARSRWGTTAGDGRRRGLEEGAEAGVAVGAEEFGEEGAEPGEGGGVGAVGGAEGFESGWDGGFEEEGRTAGVGEGEGRHGNGFGAGAGPVGFDDEEAGSGAVAHRRPAEAGVVEGPGSDVVVNELAVRAVEEADLRVDAVLALVAEAGWKDESRAAPVEGAGDGVPFGSG